MAEDTADGNAPRIGWLPGLAIELRAGGAVDAGDGARKVGSAVLVPCAAAGGWSASTAGSTPHKSRARARIDGQAVRSVMTNPGPTEGPQSDRS
jgi:hypothetical protein